MIEKIFIANILFYFERRGQKHFPEADLCGKYEFVKYLGHGSYGHVCEVKFFLLNAFKKHIITLKKTYHGQQACLRERY